MGNAEHFDFLKLKNNSLNPKTAIFLPWILVAIWLIGSAFAVFSESSELFGRFGAIGVGCVLTGFSFAHQAKSKYIAWLTNSYLAHLSVRINAARSISQVDTLKANFDLMAKLGIQIPDDVKAVTKNFDEVVDHTMAATPQIDDAIVERINRTQKKASQLAYVELLFGVLATIQWGFGDVLLNRFFVCELWDCKPC